MKSNNKFNSYEIMKLIHIFQVKENREPFLLKKVAIFGNGTKFYLFN